MKKLLYITVNSKPENMSSSKTVGRAFVNRFIEKNSDYTAEEVDLYKCHIPRLEYKYFEGRNTLLNAESIETLSKKDQDEVKTMISLTEQFKEADVYVIAAPMWSLSFPAPLKEYIDCIVMDGKTISIKEKKVEGLLNDKYRSAVYIQSSGAAIPWALRMVMNKGLNYVENVFKAMGIKKFQELLVDKTGTTEEERQQSIYEAMKKIDSIINEI
ncbi:NAD(P)H-dependent oxidoreductase [Clostridium sp. BJN0001]|uniref:FMN-dependent NADH-azoreductase n=1 Tax=Clostridium sp. BJN0001 TaxID=2930219 RepID=UPI001FD48BD6|nr:NAD(P)H-dependent oxidoreductase [Clostridium sp. BJN0001]